MNRDAIQERFERFHSANPEVYDELVTLARDAVKAGKSRVGIRMVWEAMRWQRFLKTDDPSGYKLNDHYHSRYARMIMENEPDLSGVFELRSLRTA